MTFTGLYELLGLSADCSSEQIKKAYRKLSKVHHPDNPDTGDEEKFRAIQEAYEVLSDPERRKRYDETGRVKPTKATEDRVRAFVESTIAAVINAPEGVDNPSTQNILDRVLLSMHGARVSVHNEIKSINKKLDRAKQLKKRFKTSSDNDFIAKAIEINELQLRERLEHQQDALELSLKAEEAFRLYTYEVGPESEGHSNPGPTLRLRGFGSSTTW